MVTVANTRLAACFAAAMVGMHPSLATADPASAEALFREGRKALDAGRVAEACGIFAESQRQDPSSGTLLNLADCWEREGKIASAWAGFLSAARMAAGQGLADRAREAKRRAALLEPRVSYVTINVLTPLPGLVVTRNSEMLAAAAFGTRLPADPGDHVLSASAPGRREFNTKFTIAHDADFVEVTIPSLDPAPAASGQHPPADRPLIAPPSPKLQLATSKTTKAVARRPIPTSVYLAGAGSVLALGVGTYFGVRSLASYSDAGSACPAHSACSPDALSIRSQADSQAWVANVGLGVGVGLAAVTTILFVDRPMLPEDSRAKVRVDPKADAYGLRMNFSGSF